MLREIGAVSSLQPGSLRDVRGDTLAYQFRVWHVLAALCIMTVMFIVKAPIVYYEEALYKLAHFKEIRAAKAQAEIEAAEERKLAEQRALAAKAEQERKAREEAHAQAQAQAAAQRTAEVNRGNDLRIRYRSITRELGSTVKPEERAALQQHLLIRAKVKGLSLDGYASFGYSAQDIRSRKPCTVSTDRDVEPDPPSVAWNNTAFFCAIGMSLAEDDETLPYVATILIESAPYFQQFRTQIGVTTRYPIEHLNRLWANYGVKNRILPIFTRELTGALARSAPYVLRLHALRLMTSEQRRAVETQIFPNAGRFLALNDDAENIEREYRSIPNMPPLDLE